MLAIHLSECRSVDQIFIRYLPTGIGLYEDKRVFAFGKFALDKPDFHSNSSLQRRNLQCILHRSTANVVYFAFDLPGTKWQLTCVRLRRISNCL